MDKVPEKQEVLNYATPAKAGSGDSNNRLLMFRLIWVGMLPLCYLTYLSSREFDIYQWVVFSLLTAALSGIGIYANRKLLQKSRIVFILKVLLWLFPLLLNLLAVRGGYHFNQYLKNRPTRFLIMDINNEIKHVIEAEEKLETSQRRPVNNMIEDVLKQSPNDQWGRPFLYKYPGTSRNNPYGLYSAGPDGVYGNGDDVVDF